MQVFFGVNSISYVHVSHSTCVCHSECTVVLQPPYYISPYKQSQIIVSIVCFMTSKMHSIEDCCSISCMYTGFLFCLFYGGGVCVCVCVCV